MATRVVVVPGAIDKIDTGPLLTYLGDDVAEVMRGLSPVDEGDMRSTIRVGRPSGRAAQSKIRVTVGGMKGRVTGKPVGYTHFVERGTSKMAAEPFMRPALYRYRSGGGRTV